MRCSSCIRNFHRCVCAHRKRNLHRVQIQWVGGSMRHLKTITVTAVLCTLTAAFGDDKPIGRITAAFGEAKIETAGVPRVADLHAAVKSDDRVMTDSAGVSLLLNTRVVVK